MYVCIVVVVVGERTNPSRASFVKDITRSAASARKDNERMDLHRCPTMVGLEDIFGFLYRRLCVKLGRIKRLEFQGILEYFVDRTMLFFKTERCARVVSSIKA